jgi:hypothetical protein
MPTVVEALELQTVEEGKHRIHHVVQRDVD